MVQIAPSVLASDLSCLQSELDTVETADRIHVDLMDGHFVSNISFGFPLIDAVTACTTLPVDLHVMVSNPKRHLDRFASLDVNSISVHVEATDAVPAISERLAAQGITPGIALNPSTPIEEIRPFADLVERIVLMGVEPGFSGQPFVRDTIDRIERVNADFTHPIEVDGGIDRSVAGACIDAGADVLVSGSTIFESSDRQRTIRELRRGGE